MRTTLLMLTTCLIALPGYAKYSGGSGTPADPYQIATAADLIALGATPADYDKHFILTADIDLDPNLPGRKVFDKAVIAPDANDAESLFQSTHFTGVFDGNDHEISHLTITGARYLGLFGKLLSGAEIKNLGVLDVNITGMGGFVGALVGYSDGGGVTRCYSIGSVTGIWNVGGLVGWNESNVWAKGHVTNSYSSGAVTGSSNVGGLVGYNIDGYGSRGVVTASFWDTQTSGRATSAGGTGKTTTQMKIRSTFTNAGWDFVGQTANGKEDIWWINEGKDYPKLWWEVIPKN